ncbi:MAG TPA: universal stress protein [Rhodopila sp.]|uniref:universal stress protein n=1 Tax=Rhodopila sp. TaxID=2480087 RepID=UPI002BADE82A|nr:universal stress protein [Rhodopila sp.]HVY14099.1 universal stress protein [Rhodopila sp.]
MSRYILLPLMGQTTDEPIAATALVAARLLSGHLEFLHVRRDVGAVVAEIASGDYSSGVDYDLILETLERDTADRQKAAEQTFRDCCERGGIPLSSEALAAVPTAEWRLETGDEAGLLAKHGRVADLLVVGAMRDGTTALKDLLQVALMETGRPVLLVPPRPPVSLSGVVAVAWKDRPEAARAVAAAEPFLAKADRVVILTVVEDEEGDESSGEALRHALTWHNPKTTMQVLKKQDRPAAEVLLEAAAAAGANLLVMGAYGHSRMREMIFGGFTRHMLLNANLPVLMAH